MTTHPSTSTTSRRPLRRVIALMVAGVVMGAGLLPIGQAATAAEEWNPDSSFTSTDNGDGSYRVPLLNSDVPDVSVERIPAAENDEGRDLYYMISTTMHLSPGAPIMKSYDLVNWEIVNYVFDRANIGDDFSLRNGQTSYGQGQWASSLRYHDGLWYVAFNTNNLGGSYLYTTDDIDDGSWDRISLGRSYHDPSLFFDVDGTPYIFYGSGSTSAVKYSADFSTVLAEYPQIIRPADYPNAPVGGLFEGAQVTYIDGTYYIVIITWPSGQGRQVVLFRSDDLLGRYATADGSNPYEAKGVLNSNGFAQGSLVPIAREDGGTDYWGMFFRDTFPIGRIPALIPATWGEDGWPVFGNNGNVPVGGSFRKPITLGPEQERLERLKSVVASDDFANDAPERAYMDENWTIPPGPNVDESLLGVELVQNGGFENGATGWIVNDTATLTPTADAAAGAGALQITGRQTTGSGPAQDLSGKLQRGATYDVTAKVRYTDPLAPATKQFFVTARYGASTFTNLATVTAQRGQWATITGSFTVPANQNVDTARIFVETPYTQNPQANPAQHLMDFAVDDVSVKGRPLTQELPHPDEIAPNGSRLALQWQWNHAPDNRYWSLTERDGWLRLTNGKVVTGNTRHYKLANDDEATYLEEARNTLSQRTFGPSQSAEISMDISAIKDGDVAGLAAFGRNFSYVAVKRVNGVNTVGVVNRTTPFTATIDQNAIEAFVPGSTAALGAATRVHLKADLDFAIPTGQLWTTFSYSLDGVSWNQLGNRVGPLALDGALTHFMGHRVGLFSYATQQTGGHVDIDHFLVSDARSAQNLPLDTAALEAAVAHAETLSASDYPAADWQAMQSALAWARAAQQSPFGTQNQIDGPERALSLELARLAVIRPAPSLGIELSAATRCAAGKVQVTALVTNPNEVPVQATVSSVYGTKTFAAVAPEKAASHAFTTRQTSIGAREVTVTVTAEVDGEQVTTTVSQSYAARSCG